MNQWEKAIDRHFVVDFNLKIHLFSKLLSLICSTQQRKSNRNELIVCRSCVVCLYIWSCVAMFLLLSHHFVRSVIWAEKILEGMARFGAEMLSKHKCAKLLFITKQTTRLHKKRFTGLNWKRNVRLEMLAKLISLWLHCEVILRPRSRTSQKKKSENIYHCRRQYSLYDVEAVICHRSERREKSKRDSNWEVGETQRYRKRYWDHFRMN